MGPDQSGFGKFPLKNPKFSIFSPLDQRNLIGLGQIILRIKDGLAPTPLFTTGQ